MPGLPVVSSRAPRVNSSPRCSSGMPGPSSSTRISTIGALGLDRHEHPAAAIFGGILDEVAEHFVEVLALDPDLRLVIAGDVDGDVLVQPVDRALDGLEAFPHARARLGRRRGGRSPGRGRDGGRPGGASPALRGIRCRRGRARRAVAALVMTVSGVFSAWARLPAWRRASSACASLCASSWLISSVSGRISVGKSWPMRVLSPERIDGDFAAHAAQRPQAVEGLQRGEDEQADAERGEAPDQGRAQPVDLVVDRLARLRDLEAPADLRARAGSRRARRCAAARHGRDREFVAVVEVRLHVVMACRRRAAAGPTASATGRCRRRRR